MLQWLRRIFERASRQKRKNLHLVITDERAALFTETREVWTFRWAQVTHVQTYKVDLFAVDMICLDFFVEFQETGYSTDEEMQGFDILCEQLRHHFPSIAEDWWARVAFPVFATNGEVLYEKPFAYSVPNNLSHPENSV